MVGQFGTAIIIPGRVKQEEKGPETPSKPPINQGYRKEASRREKAAQDLRRLKPSETGRKV